MAGSDQALLNYIVSARKPPPISDYPDIPDKMTDGALHILALFPVLLALTSRPDPLRSAISALFDHRWEYPLVPAIGGSDQAARFRLPQAARRCWSRAC